MDSTLVYETGDRGSIPLSGTKISAVTSMDRLIVFETVNVGSIPARRTNI